ncbi:hypothetical protein ACFVXC_09250 [Streptomyces sp. NPDC058257]|uniref:hypothetical protein n=1 Tax=Streptomyces sp. NPDC058257 TaxID=3346409 RepID=UPI0036E7860A
MSIHRRRATLRTAAVTAVATSALLAPAVSAVAAVPDAPAHAKAATKDTRGMKGMKGMKDTENLAPGAPVTQVAPKGSVKAGTEGFNSGDPVFIAAGGAMAAAGAAGLGYSMMRRGRSDA